MEYITSKRLAGTMTRDEIYDHLAQVYLGKRESVVEVKKPIQKQKPYVWFVMNIGITVVVLLSVVLGLTAFLTQRNDVLKSKIVYALNNSPLRLSYIVGGEYPHVKKLTIDIPSSDVSDFSKVNVSLKSMKDAPGILKMVLTNAREEQAVYYLKGIDQKWRDFSVSFEELNLSDWKSLKNISFVVEAWNASSQQGVVLIDNISFSN